MLIALFYSLVYKIVSTSADVKHVTLSSSANMGFMMRPLKVLEKVLERTQASWKYSHAKMPFASAQIKQILYHTDSLEM